MRLMRATKSLERHTLRTDATTAREKRQDIMDCAALAKVHTPAAIRTLARALNNPTHCVAAANALLDRAWGKPAQTVHSETNVNILHLIAAQAFGEQLQMTGQTNVDTPVIEATAQDDNDAPAKE